MDNIKKPNVERTAFPEYDSQTSENGSSFENVRQAAREAQSVEIPPEMSPRSDSTSAQKKISNVSTCILDDIPVIRNSRGRPVWCSATAIALFVHHPDWQRCLRRDDFLQRNMLYRPIPGTDEGQDFKIREITDIDVVNAQVWCNKIGFPEAAKTTIIDAFQTVAFDNSIDPLKQWLEGLMWDGYPTPRPEHGAYPFPKLQGRFWTLWSPLRAILTLSRGNLRGRT